MKFQKICKACGEPFETNSSQKIYCNRQHYRPCPICGKPVPMIDNDFSRKPRCCSTKCSHELRKQNLPKRICAICGDEFIPNSGVGIICPKDHFIPCEVCGKMIPIKNLDDPTTCSPECAREKSRRKCRAKYGVDHPMQCEEVRQHHREAMVSKYGVEYALQLEEFSNKQQQTAIKTNLQQHGVPYACLLPQCIEAQGKIVSNINHEFANKLKNAGIQYTFEKRIGPYSYDICIEDQKILIEIDPSYTHSTVPTHWGSHVDKMYHKDKSTIAAENGYRCIHIFDWDDPDKIINLLKPTTRIFARKCRLFKLNLEYTRSFLNDNHLQGSCNGQLLCLGLVYGDQLMQVMTFGKSRYDKHHAIELLRLCTKTGYSVIGGASRLINHAIAMFDVNNVISYCDLSKFNGSVYSNIGMKLLRVTPPQEIWSKGTKKITANLLRQRGYDQLFGTNYGKGTSNNELMLSNGWLPVYDCGQAVYELKI